MDLRITKVITITEAQKAAFAMAFINGGIIPAIKLVRSEFTAGVMRASLRDSKDLIDSDGFRDFVAEVKGVGVGELPW